MNRGAALLAVGALAGCGALLGVSDLTDQQDGGAAGVDSGAQEGQVTTNGLVPGADAGTGADSSTDSTTPSDAAAEGASDSATPGDGGCGSAVPKCPTASGVCVLVDNATRTGMLAATDTAVFWTDPEGKAVHQVPIAGGAPITLASSMAVLPALAMSGNTVFFSVQSSASGNGMWQLRSAAAGATNASTLVGEYDGVPTGLALDPGYVYAFNNGTAGMELLGLPRDGGAPINVSNPPNVDPQLVVSGIVLAWTYAPSGWIVGVATSHRGGGALVLTSAQDSPALITQAGGVLYWVNQAPGAVLIKKMSALSSTSSPVVNLPNPAAGLASDSANVFWTDDVAGTVRLAATSGAPPYQATLATGLCKPGPLAVTLSSVVWLDRATGALMKVPR